MVAYNLLTSSSSSMNSIHIEVADHTFHSFLHQYNHLVEVLNIQFRHEVSDVGDVT